MDAKQEKDLKQKIINKSEKIKAAKFIIPFGGLTFFYVSRRFAWHYESILLALIGASDHRSGWGDSCSCRTGSKISLSAGTGNY